MKVVFKDEQGRIDMMYDMNGSAHTGNSDEIIMDMLDNCGCEYKPGEVVVSDKYMNASKKSGKHNAEEELLKEINTEHKGLGLLNRFSKLVNPAHLFSAYISIVDLDIDKEEYPGAVSIHKDNKIEAFEDTDNVEYFDCLDTRVVPDVIHIIYKTEAEAERRIEKLAVTGYIDTSDAMATIREYTDCSGHKVAEFWLASEYRYEKIEIPEDTDKF